MQKTSSSNGASSAPGSAALPPNTPSSSSFPFSSLFGSTIPRTPRRPGTSSGPTTASGLGPGTFGNGTAFGDPFQDPSSSAIPRRAFTFGSPPPPAAGAGAGGGGGGGGLLRKNSLGRKPSLGDASSYSQLQQQSQSLFKGLRRRANSISALRDRDGAGAAPGVGRPLSPPPEPPPALPEYALSSAAKISKEPESFASPSSRSNSNSMDSTGAFIQSSGRMLNRSGTMPTNGYATGGPGMMAPPLTAGLQSESSMVHQHIQEMANKRISTLEYLRKAYVLPDPLIPQHQRPWSCS